MAMASRVLGWSVAVVLLLVQVGCGGHAEPTVEADTAPKPIPVTVAPVGHQTVERTVEVVGTLKGWEEVTVGAKLSGMGVGRVARIHHDMGDRVKPGEVIVELETVDAELAVEQAERQLQVELAKLGLGAEMANRDLKTDLLPKSKEFDVSKLPSVVQAQVAVERARLNLERERRLSQRGAGTFQDLQNAENDEKAAAASLENATLTARATLANALSAKVALDVARQGRKDMEIRAPVPSAPPRGYRGAITYALTERLVSEGQMIKQGDPVADLAIENPLRLWANVPERFGAEIRLDQPVRIAVAAYSDRVFEGKVARINPAVDPVSRTFQVEVAVPNDESLLRPGGFAKASILTRRDAQATTVPMESVVQFAGVSKVFIVEGDKAREVKIETGLEGPGWVEVSGDLPTEAQVVTTGQTQLAEGTPVIIRRPEPATTAGEAHPEPAANAAPGTAG